MKRYSTAALLLAMMSMSAYGEDAPVKGAITAVTVYRGQALVTRAIDLPAKAGLAEVVVSELPERLLPGSLFAEADGNVEVRSVSYRARAVAKDVREAVQKFDDEIRGLQDQLTANSKQREILAEQKTYLDKLSNFTAPTASVELTKGVLDAKQLQSLAEYQFAQRKSIAEQDLALANAARDLQEKINLAYRKRNEITGGSSTTLREAVVFVNQPQGGGKLRLRYLVDGATWTPSYNVRADAEKKNANIEYQASIQQMSGEDWSNVAMTLSTASPSLVAAAPMLNPLNISLAVRGGSGPEIRYDMAEAENALRSQQRLAEMNRNGGNFKEEPGLKPGGSGGGGFGGGRGRQSGATTINNGALAVVNDDDRDLNKLADQQQYLELVAKEGKRDESIRNAGEGIVVTYVLKNSTSLPSRADRQLIQIKNFPIKSQFYKLAVPVLTNFVYDEATLTNTGDTVLLAGPLASYVGGQFVGNGEIPTVAVGQNFSVGFGIDSSLRASRERTDRTESVQGGNKVVKYSYHITVENYGTTPAAVRIMDRMPTAKETEMKIKFDPAKDVAISADKDYQQFDFKKGLLRWDTTVQPQKTRTDAFSMDYKLELEFDKNLGISTAGTTDLKAFDETMKNLDIQFKH